jgi:nucleotide-binding universal stress UspA family protein
MQISDLVVHVDASQRCRARLELAAWLARRYDAHLRGVYVTSLMEMSPFLADRFRSQDLDEMYARVTQQREAAEALFRECCIGPSGTGGEWIEERGDVNDVLTFYGRHADLLILGQSDPRDQKQRSARFIPEAVVLGTGQPVIMVPFSGSFRTLGERILIAWNASAQASRAVRDALPFLIAAKEVTVFVVEQKVGIESTSENIVRHLKNHGIEAELERMTADNVEVGDLVLSRAADKSVDLIVMGAYGHSRARELAFGGVSRQLFAQMTVPLLMSH